jgi:N-acetylglucosaminyl-diphospho-decaprenol L-rhamnosyltransferase
VAGVSAIVVSHNSRPHLRRCLDSLSPQVAQTIVVDAASTDGSIDDLRAGDVVRLDANRGYGAALNAGAARATGDLLLLLNADTWALPGAVDELARALADTPAAGVAGPKLVNEDGSTQRSVRGFPTPWRLATEYFFLRWFAPRSRALNAFYAAGFDHATPRAADWLVGAALLVRREAFDSVAGFDESFFMYNEEVDFCYRLARAGWSTIFVPSAQVGHVGGASTRALPEEMYLEQLRSHLRFLDKHRGPRSAERTRRMLVWAMRLRSIVFRGPRSAISSAAARWAASASAAQLIQAAEEDPELNRRRSGKN